jgi:hypothetical protein
MTKKELKIVFLTFLLALSRSFSRKRVEKTEIVTRNAHRQSIEHDNNNNNNNNRAADVECFASDGDVGWPVRLLAVLVDVCQSTLFEDTHRRCAQSHAFRVPHVSSASQFARRDFQAFARDARPAHGARRDLSKSIPRIRFDVEIDHHFSHND